jgi:hypothetical protein
MAQLNQIDRKPQTGHHTVTVKLPPRGPETGNTVLKNFGKNSENPKDGTALITQTEEKRIPKNRKKEDVPETEQVTDSVEVKQSRDI